MMNDEQPKEKTIFDRWREQEIVVIHKTEDGKEKRTEISCGEDGRAVSRVLDEGE